MQQRRSILKSPERIMFFQRREGLANSRRRQLAFRLIFGNKSIAAFLHLFRALSSVLPAGAEKAEDWSLTHIVYHQSHTPHTFSTSVFHPLFPTPAYQSNSAPQSDSSHPFCWLHGYDGAVVESTHLHTPTHTDRDWSLYFMVLITPGLLMR